MVNRPVIQQTDEEMLAELGALAEMKAVHTHTAEEERVIAGFEDILKFVTTHGRPPLHGEDRDIFERLYAVRLDRLREQTRFHDLLAPMDEYGLLRASEDDSAALQDLDDDALLAELGLGGDDPDAITTLRHVAPRNMINAADEVASRSPCPDFADYKPLFDQVREDLRTGVRQARKFVRDASIKQGEFFILGGQLAYVAFVPDEMDTEHGHRNGRLRVIFDNATQSETLLRSFQRALYKPELDGRRISDPELGPLFGSEPEDGDVESGTIYVLRSRSDHPFIAAHRDVIHKIGVTGGRVETRLAGAASDPTYLMAPVDVVATYKLSGIDRRRLEAIFHRVFATSRLDLAIPDRFGGSARPREWFLAPLPVIDEVVTRIRDGSITDLTYEPATASLVKSG
ncbi:MAG: GIY-YIG nuclease family protein [Phenylobacterium sp.]|uniref:GIY-YIG nuclease family protein n=1 Tax=Phenylobacterium sp. TaxID=1871053 RepID=UPI00273240B6|nr:GIY-YIG nuclease family protein [Phenylobacterium sp.]MDP3175058.1 GIY-YIG nuclease family protein [Phenylobacterium sp.]